MNFFTTPARVAKYFLNAWPPFWFTGIRVEKITSDFCYIRVGMRLRFYNKNLHGLQFGGSLYSMTDPCYLMMILRNLGPGYRVLDKSAHIDFIKPGRSKVVAEFRLSQEDLNDIKMHTETGEKYFKDFVTDVLDKKGELVARVTKTIYIRKKSRNKLSR